MSRPWLRLAQLVQDGFVLVMLVGAAWGYLLPEQAAAGARWIPEALAAVMLGMGLTLTGAQLRAVRAGGRPLLIGVALQFTVMPLVGWGLATLFGLSPALALGVVLVGSCPGGTASNVITFLARGEVALSVAMTATSTLLSPILTPFWVWLLASQWIPVDPLTLFWSVTRIVLLPVLGGIVLRRMWSPGPLFLEGMLPLFSMIVIAWIVGIVVGLNQAQLGSAGIVLLVVVLHNGVGLAAGYWGGGFGGQPVRRRRTIAIEVGMQNSGLAVALTQSVAVLGLNAAQAAIPGALFSVWHNVTGPLLASLWRRRRPPWDDRHVDGET